MKSGPLIKLGVLLLGYLCLLAATVLILGTPKAHADTCYGSTIPVGTCYPYVLGQAVINGQTQSQLKNLPSGTALLTRPPTAANANIRFPNGPTPTTLNEGDCWNDDGAGSLVKGFYCYINGVIVGPLGAGGGITLTEGSGITLSINPCTGTDSCTISSTSSGGALIKLCTVTVSSAATLNLDSSNGCTIDSTYNNYMIVFAGLQFTTGVLPFPCIRVSTASGYDTGNNYAWESSWTHTGGTQGANGSNSNTLMQITGSNPVGTNSGLSGSLTLGNLPSTSVWQSVNGVVSGFDATGTNAWSYTFSGWYNPGTTVAVNGVQFLTSTATGGAGVVSGTASLYGIAQ